MPTRLMASAGPATDLFEAMAASIGSGMVVGGFAIGAVSFALSRSRALSERAAVAGGYGGGFAGLLALVTDSLWERFV